MYLVEDKGGAIALMLAALCFLGTWPALISLQERRGRFLQHTYLDYSITNYLVAILIALTLGQIGPSTSDRPNFITQLGQNNWPSVAFALAGGLFLSLGNLATQYGWPFVGLSVTEVVTASITVVLGTTMNYFLDGRINRAAILFPGVGCFLTAVCLGAALHASNSKDVQAKLQNAEKGNSVTEMASLGREPRDIEKNSHQDEKLATALAGGKLEDQMLVKSAYEKADRGTAEYLKQVEDKRTVKVTGASTLFGLAIVFFAGLCFAMFSPAFNVATNDQWHRLKHGVPHLVVYAAFFWFSTSCFVFGFGINLVFLYRPLIGLPKSSVSAYLSDSWNDRKWALVAGCLCGFGNGFQFMGGQAAGYAAADAVQALPLVSTFWGILLFAEYHRSSRRTYNLLTAMLLMFIVAVAVLMSSSGHRKN